MPRGPKLVIDPADIVEAGAREHYADAALYDYEYRRRRADVTFYRQLAAKRVPPGGSILELGAGSGRVTLPLAHDGFRVIAIDRAPAMLDKLRERVDAAPVAVRKRITVAEGDLRGFRVRGRFPLIVAAFNVVEHLYTRGEVDACLRAAATHLAPGGAFVFDVQVPDLPWLARDPGKRWARTRFTDPSTGEKLVYSTNHDYDPIAQIALIRIYYTPPSGPEKVVQLSQRKFFPAELEALVAHAGLRVSARFGDFFWGPLDARSETQVLVCERRSSSRKSRFPTRI
ncbi:MAG TPA: methyltransferase domain-containing protein [Kofleriaceae bacterium]|jgi:SAM-dependent methyltransferase